MNYEYIEELVSEAKSGTLKAKESLVLEFTPFINSISRKTFIHGYEVCDIKNECFKTLFICISKYQLETHRFVAYAINAIKNNINCLIRTIVKRKDLDGFLTLSLSNDTEQFLQSDMPFLDEEICNLYSYDALSSAIKDKLNDEEKHLVSFLYFKGNTLMNYAYYKNISYVTALKRKKKVLAKLKNVLNGGNEL